MASLAGRRIMVVEDSYFLAMEVKSALEGWGAEVIGPFGTVQKALQSLQERLPDFAVLDLKLDEDASFDLARVLRTGGVPFLFFTGYDPDVLPPEFADVRLLEKPASSARLLQAVGTCCRPASTST